MCSLFQTETTYPYFKKMSKDVFETMHAPRLYEFLESTVEPFANHLQSPKRYLN
jgi:hypothetical protein